MKIFGFHMTSVRLASFMTQKSVSDAPFPYYYPILKCHMTFELLVNIKYRVPQKKYTTLKDYFGIYTFEF